MGDSRASGAGKRASRAAHLDLVRTVGNLFADQLPSIEVR